MSGVEQQEEFISILDEHKKTNLNAIIMQIRPACDAFYPSPYEPWSEYLTGTQGKPPSDPYYDPLEFMIDETHKRGMEFHAWFNPYRAVHDTKTSSIAPTSVVNLHPEWVVKYANYQMLDPGLQEVRDYIASVIEDIIDRLHEMPGWLGTAFAFQRFAPERRRSPWFGFLHLVPGDEVHVDVAHYILIHRARATHTDVSHAQ